MKSTVTSAMLGISILLSPTLGARSLSPDEALSRALGVSPLASINTRAASEYTLSYTSMMPDSITPGCYLFKSDTGFIIASADDRARALLAYGEDTSIDTDKLSPEFKYWLEEYGREMASVPDVPDVDPGIEYPKGAITPLCKTKWNQFGPYYDMCSKAYGQPVVTGCVATAMAQMLKYHNWPPTGVGEITYTSDGKEFSYDYATGDFNWDAMLDTYRADSPQTSKEAVANLMYACGVSVGMHYHPGGSGADPAVMCGSLPKHMKYDASIYNAQRFYYTLEEWMNLIYSQISKVGPVQYSGYVSSGGGHSFICDGYDGNGYFHINWGWGGASDGYYLLSALSPDHRGIGPAEARGGFNFNQDAIINVFPAGETPSDPYFGVMNASNFGVAQSWSWLGKEIGVHGIYWNTGCTRISGQFGIRAISQAGDTIIMPGRVVDTYGINEALGGYSAHLPDYIAPGEYTITPVFKYLGEWRTVMTAVDQRSDEKMTVKEVDGRLKAIFTQPATGGSITAIDLTAPEKFDPKKYVGIKSTIQNTTPNEWVGAVAAAIYTMDDKLIAYGMRMELDLLPNTEQPLDYSSEMKYVVLEDSLHNGPAQLRIINYGNRKPISAAIPVTLVDLASSDVNSITPSTQTEFEPCIYRIDGMRISNNDNTGELPHGLYIVIDRNGTRRKILK